MYSALVPDIELYGLEFADENTEGETEIECLLGETGLDVLVGDADADRMGGDPGGVSRGVLVWDANNRLRDMRGLEAGKITDKKNRSENEPHYIYGSHHYYH